MVTAVKVGDVIKSLDFPGNENCYIIGRVIALLDDGDYINCSGITRVWEGRAEPGRDFRCAAEGLHFMDEQFPGRITVVA